MSVREWFTLGIGFVAIVAAMGCLGVLGALVSILWHDFKWRKVK